jgi:hypothetical protein
MSSEHDDRDTKPATGDAGLKEYPPGTAFTGRMGRTIGESEPAWPAPVRAKPGAGRRTYQRAARSCSVNFKALSCSDP